MMDDGKRLVWHAALWFSALLLATGCTSTAPPSQGPIATGAVGDLTDPVDLRYRAGQLTFQHTIRLEETDNAVPAGRKRKISAVYHHTAHGVITSTPLPSGLTWRLEVTGMDVDGQPVSHRRVPLTTATVISDNVGRILSDWQIRLPAYEKTGALRFFSSGRLAGLEADTRQLARDLIPVRFPRVERSGDRVQHLDDASLQSLLRRAGIEALPDGWTPLVLAVDGERMYEGRKTLSASVRHHLEFDTWKPFRQHRLTVEAVCLVALDTGLPVASYGQYDLQSTHLSYTRNRRLWKKTTFEPR